MNFKHILNRIIGKDWICQNLLKRFIMKSLNLEKKTLFWLVCPSRFLFVYTCSWFVDMSLYVCIMNVYMFVYWLYTERHFCLLYSVINSWNSYTTSQCKCLVTYVRYSSTLVYNTSSETVIQIVLHFYLGRLEMYCLYVAKHFQNITMIATEYEFSSWIIHTSWRWVWLKSQVFMEIHVYMYELSTDS